MHPPLPPSPPPLSLPSPPHIQGAEHPPHVVKLHTTHCVGHSGRRRCAVSRTIGRLCLLEVLLLIWEASLDKRQLRLADPAHPTQPGLALGGFFPVKMRLARAPVQHLWRPSSRPEARGEVSREILQALEF